ncbi:MAG: hypothetical protein ACSLFB_02320 [Acidimicrobiales bacterium]
MNDPADIKNVLAQAKQTISENERKTLERLRAQTFNRVTLILIRAFVSFIGILFLFVIIASLLGIQWKDGYEALLEVIKIAVVPITTTILGYYIGREKSE